MKRKYVLDIHASNDHEDESTTNSSDHDSDILNEGFIRERGHLEDQNDRRAVILEKDWLNSELTKQGKRLVILEDLQDNNCLYRAFAYGVSRLAPPCNHDYKSEDLRWIAGTYMKESPRLFRDSLLLDAEFVKYCNDILYRNTPADADLELVALTHYFKIAVNLYVPTHDGMWIKHIGTKYCGALSIDIAYHPIGKMFNPIVNINA
jgi:hypothetical protein